jgi:V8-like Glu-specific endopeptidase
MRTNIRAIAGVGFLLASINLHGCGGGSGDGGDPCSSLLIAGGEQCETRPIEVAGVATDSGYCTGTFISTRHVLTAAHCLPPRGNRILVATKGFSAETKTARAHPGYSAIGISPFDVAVITLNEDAPVSPAPIEVSIDVNKGDRVVAYGYGIDEEGDDIVERVESGGKPLKATFLDVNGVSDESIQTISDGSGDTCGGDSGGPVVRQGSNGEYGIVAVVRSGPNTCVPDVGIPGDNTNVQTRAVLDFILGIVPGARLN